MENVELVAGRSPRRTIF